MNTFILIVLGQIISLFGNAALRFALPLYLLRQTGSAALYGGITVAGLAGCAFGGGNMVDMVIIIVSGALFGLIGFLDDFIKVAKKHNLGLRAYQKLLLQIPAAGPFDQCEFGIHGTLRSYSGMLAVSELNINGV